MDKSLISEVDVEQRSVKMFVIIAEHHSPCFQGPSQSGVRRAEGTNYLLREIHTSVAVELVTCSTS